MTTACEPGRFCPDHPVDPGLLVLIAVTIVAFALAATAAGLLAAVVATAARRIRRRTRRPAAPIAPAAQEELPPGPAPHLAVIAAALDDWWLLTDPRAEFNGTDIAPRIEIYLISSGYHITPNP